MEMLCGSGFRIERRVVVPSFGIQTDAEGGKKDKIMRELANRNILCKGTLYKVTCHSLLSSILPVLKNWFWTAARTSIRI